MEELTLFIQLPKKRLFWPRINVRVHDSMYGGLHTPMIGYAVSAAVLSPTLRKRRNSLAFSEFVRFRSGWRNHSIRESPEAKWWHG